jgi:hypothetical protein
MISSAKDALPYSPGYQQEYGFGYRLHELISTAGPGTRHEIDGTVTLEITDETSVDLITMQMLEVTFNISRNYYSYWSGIRDSTETYYDYKDRTYYRIVYFDGDAWIVDESFDINNPGFEDAFLMMDEVCVGSSFHPIFLNYPGIINTDRCYFRGISSESGDLYFDDYYSNLSLSYELGITEAGFSSEPEYASSLPHGYRSSFWLLE